MKVLCIGRSFWKMIVNIDNYPEENMKYQYKDAIINGGGTTLNTAYLLGKWGVDTIIATAVGSDDYGTKIKKLFQDINVNTNYIETIYDKDTSFSFDLINTTSGNGTIFNILSDELMLKKYNYDFIPDIIFTDGSDYGATQNAISKNPNALSIIAAENTTSEILELCKYMKYIVCSKGFAEGITNMKFDFNNPTSLTAIYDKLQNKYPNANIIITLKDHGALYQSNYQVKIMPGLKIEVRDATSAGDIFCGTFIYSLTNSFDMDKAITLANIAAGLSCTKIGTINSIPSLSEVLDYYTKKMGYVNNSSNNNQANSIEEHLDTL